MATLRYTGETPVSIPALGVDVEPGGLFEAPAEIADELCARDDFKPSGARYAETVDEVLSRVDHDPVEAAKALAEEEAGDKPRKSLVGALTEIIEAAQADPSEED